MIPMNPNPGMQSSQAFPMAMGGDIKSHCRKYMGYHVICHSKDGHQFEGIIDGMDEDGVTMLVPEDVDGEEVAAAPMRQPFGRPRFRRFIRHRFPFTIFLFPFFTPYPYFSPYPYYPWYGY